MANSSIDSNFSRFFDALSPALLRSIGARLERLFKSRADSSPGEGLRQRLEAVVAVVTTKFNLLNQVFQLYQLGRSLQSDLVSFSASVPHPQYQTEESLQEAHEGFCELVYKMQCFEEWREFLTHCVGDVVDQAAGFYQVLDIQRANLRSYFELAYGKHSTLFNASINFSRFLRSLTAVKCPTTEMPSLQTDFHQVNEFFKDYAGLEFPKMSKEVMDTIQAHLSAITIHADCHPTHAASLPAGQGHPAPVQSPDFEQFKSLFAGSLMQTHTPAVLTSMHVPAQRLFTPAPLHTAGPPSSMHHLMSAKQHFPTIDHPPISSARAQTEQLPGCTD
ncbi:hypothetical protein, partial [Litorimonas sp.]|uniref:hypothetical protein n=1 Tax=Litorimonas sp. TaxID=1892381 RepID=UPI003A8B5F6E